MSELTDDTVRVLAATREAALGRLAGRDAWIVEMDAALETLRGQRRALCDANARDRMTVKAVDALVGEDGAAPAAVEEPSMEEILTSIRRIIREDAGER